MEDSWSAWIGHVWGDLARKARLVVPAGLPHPSAAGFSEPWLSESAGQSRDWALSLADGSRLHVHEYPDGTMTVHRDAIDPSSGPIRAASHFLTETSLGRLAFLVGVAALAAAGVRAAGLPCRSAVAGVLT